MYKETNLVILNSGGTTPVINSTIYGCIDQAKKSKLFDNIFISLFGVDGLMIGRTSIGNPWFFNEVKTYLNEGFIIPEPSLQEKLEVVREHLDFSIRWKGERLGLLEMRRHYARYFKGIQDFKKYRTQLVTIENKEELFSLLNTIEEQFLIYQE